MPDLQREDEALVAWSNLLAAIDGSQIEVLKRPDRDAPGRGGCDAIVRRNGGRVAVEHTTIHAYANQEEDDLRFRRVVVPLEERIRQEFPDSWIEIYVQAHAVPTGLDWGELANRLVDRVCAAISTMPLADPWNDRATAFQWPDVPFDVWLIRQQLDGFDPTCCVARWAPHDAAEQRTANVERAIRAKSRTLYRYRPAHETALLLDFDHVSLLNHRVVAAAFRSACSACASSDAIDEVYLIDKTRRAKTWVLPVKRRGIVYPDLPDYELFRRELCRLTWGW